MKKRQQTRKALLQIWFVANAVSYRIPIPVTEVIECCSTRSYFPVCPRCSDSIVREYMAFCDRCGQRLSWHALRWADVIELDDGNSLGISK